MIGAAWRVAVVAAVLGWTTPGHAWDTTAYAQLLARHVRAGAIAGIQLAVVDYAAVEDDPAYRRALADLAAARPEALPSDGDRIAFWINAYNLLAIKAVVDQYPVRSIRDGGTLFRSIWKKPVGVAGGREYALDDIEHGILRKRFREPRIHVAIVCASLSCPDLRGQPYTGAGLDAELDDAARRFLANPTKGLALAADGRTARVSSIFKWFGQDFGGPDGVAAFVRQHAPAELRGRLEGLTAAGLAFLEYDWSLNDARRSARGG